FFSSRRRHTRFSRDWSSDVCSSDLTDADFEMRKNLGYQKESPTEDTQCQHCNLWLPPRPNESCGGCTLFTGPIEPTGTCTYWAQIGRASCRERGEMLVVAVAVSRI